MSTEALTSAEALDFESVERRRVRTALGGLDRQIVELGTQTTLDGYSSLSKTVAASFADLVTVLAVPEEPVMRSCPSCKSAIRAGATRCKYCWKKSEATGH